MDMTTETTLPTTHTITASGQMRFSSPEDGQSPYVLSAASTTIGAGPKCDLRLDAPGLRPLHCVVTQDDDRVTVRRWSAGTKLNGRPFTESALQNGDCLSIGTVDLYFSTGAGGEPEEVQQPRGFENLETYDSEICQDQEADAQALEGERDEAGDGPVEGLDQQVLSEAVEVAPDDPQADSGEPMPGEEIGWLVEGIEESADSGLESSESSNAQRAAELFGSGSMLADEVSQDELLDAIEQAASSALSSWNCSQESDCPSPAADLESDPVSSFGATAPVDLIPTHLLLPWGASQGESTDSELAEVCQDSETGEPEFAEETTEQTTELAHELQALADDSVPEASVSEEPVAEAIEEELSSQVGTSEEEAPEQSDSPYEYYTDVAWDTALLGEPSETCADGAVPLVSSSPAEPSRNEAHTKALRSARSKARRLVQLARDERRQAKDAHGLSEQLRSECDDLSSQMESLRAELEEHLQAAAQHASDSEASQAKLTLLSDRQAAAEAACEELRRELDEKTSSIAELTAAKEAVDSGLDGLKLELEQARQELEQSRQEIAEQRTAAEQAQQELAAALEAGQPAETQHDLVAEVLASPAEAAAPPAPFASEAMVAALPLETQSLEPACITEPIEQEESTTLSPPSEQTAEELETPLGVEQTHQKTHPLARPPQQAPTPEAQEASTNRAEELQADVPVSQPEEPAVASNTEHDSDGSQDVSAWLESFTGDKRPDVQTAESPAKSQVADSDGAIERVEPATDRPLADPPAAGLSAAETEGRPSELSSEAAALAEGSPAAGAQPAASPEQPETPVFEAPKSFVEQFAHLLPSDDESQSAEPEPATEVAASPETVDVSPSASPAAGEEEDIDTYMAQLLQRMRGDEPAESSADTPVEQQVEEPEEAPEPEAPPEAPAPIVSLNEITRSSAPEQATDMDSLRQVANQSARQAIGVAASKQSREKSLANLVIATVALGSGGYLVYSAPSLASSQFLGGGFAFLLAGVWVARSLTHLVQAYRNGRLSDVEPRPVKREDLPIA